MAKKRLEDLLVELSSDDEKSRQGAVIKLGDHNEPEALRAIKSALLDPSASVRFYAKKSLQKMEPRFDAQELAASAPLDEATQAKVAAVHALRTTGPPEAIEPFLTEKDPFVRATAAIVLPDLGPAEMRAGSRALVDHAIALFEDRNGRVVANAVEAIERWHHEPAIDDLKNLLFHEDARVKANVAKALFTFASVKPDLRKMALARLREIIDHAKPWIRQSAVFALAAIGTEEAADILRSALADPEKMIKEQAQEALKNLGARPKAAAAAAKPAESGVSASPPSGSDGAAPEGAKPAAADQAARKEPAGAAGMAKSTTAPSAKAATPTAAKPVAVAKPAGKTHMAAAPSDDEDEERRERWKARAKTAGLALAAIFALICVTASLHAIYELVFQIPTVRIIKAPAGTVAPAPPEAAAAPGAGGREAGAPAPATDAAADPALADLAEGIALLKTLDFDGAIGKLRGVLALAPESEQLKMLLAVAITEKARRALELGDAAAAESLLAEARGITEYPAQRTLAAEILLKQGDAAAACDEAAAGAAGDPKSAAAQYAFGSALLKAGKNAGMAEAFARAAELEPANAKYRIAYGRSLFRAGREEEGIAEVAEGVRLAPGPSSYKLLLDTAKEAGRPAFALAAFRELLRTRPDDAALLEPYADLLMQLGMHPAALEIYERLLATRPNDADLHFRAGLCHQAEGDLRGMRSAFERAVRAKPDFFEARYALGKVLLFEKEGTLARKEFEAALKLRPDSEPVAVELARMHMDDGKFALALPPLEGVLKANPDSVEARLIAGQACALLVRPAEARAHFERFLALEPPGSPRAPLVKAALEKMK